jgi:adenine-specific DNA methylase
VAVKAEPHQEPAHTAAKRSIEESFPIVEINRLAIPERNAFKPIYQMHKWFARRASCVFRAILLGALKPAGTDIMEEFYKDHTHDPDTNGKVIIDPFMGGGTTVVEALRLGCMVIGIDLNPVAWFIVKTEVEPVDTEELKAAFERLADRKTPSGRTVREELLSHYKTRCPVCGNEKADIIYTFWVKSAICTNPECKKQVPLFSDYLVAQKMPSVRFFSDANCPHTTCGKTFDWEIEPAALVGEEHLMLASARDGAGEGRGNRRWTYSLPGSSARCPWCKKNIIPQTRSAKAVRKKVRVSVVYCPHCAIVFQYRGTLPEEIECPGCLKSFSCEKGNVSDKGKFRCLHCGQGDAIIESIRRLPDDQLLPTRMYALQGYCSNCTGDGEEGDEEDQQVLSGEIRSPKRSAIAERGQSTGVLWKNKGKFYKVIDPADEKGYQIACHRWDCDKERMPYPKQEIPDGQETHRLLEHHYQYWHQLFNPRQLLCLSTLVQGIGEEPEQNLKELLLTTLFNTLESNNVFTRNRKVRESPGGTAPGGIFSRHDYQPKATFCEQNVWGTVSGSCTFQNCFEKVLEGKEYNRNPFDRRVQDGRQSEVQNREIVNEDGLVEIAARSSTVLNLTTPVEAIITDPPYAGNVNYSELGDFFYVWLRLLLAKSYPEFAPELSPKADEIIENRTRGKTLDDFQKGLTDVFRESNRASSDSGLLIFTFHHKEEEAWEALLQALCEAGWTIEAVYPIQGDAENAMPLLSLNPA